MNMCAAKSGTPSLMSAGAAMTAQMMYEAVTGTASPTTQTMSEVYTAVSSSEPPAYSMMMALNFRPRPVSVTTPTMMPAPAQVAATLSTPVEPASTTLKKGDGKICLAIGPRPRNRSYENSAQSRCRKLVRNDTTVAQNTDSTGEKPYSMKITIDTSDRKWNQYFLVRFQSDSTCSNFTVCMPNLRASISTIRNSAK